MTNNQETNTAYMEKAFQEHLEEKVGSSTRRKLYVEGSNVTAAARTAFKAGFTARARLRDGEIAQLQEENIKLKFMIDNGLGWEDLKNDVSYPNG